MPDDYPSLLAEIKERVRSAQYEALRAALSRLRSGLDYGGQVASAYAKASAGKHTVKVQN